MDSSEEEKSDFICREYQADLLDKAIKENLILYLPTGAGKTFIATMLIKEFSKIPRTLEIKYTEGGKRSFFLTNTVALVTQQALAIGRHTHFAIGEYCGDMGVDYWTENQWLKELDNHQVLVMTCQIFLDMLLHNMLKLEQVNVVVFDECHHAVNNQPMRQIMQQFQFCEKSKQPRVLGLTATLINSNCKADTLESEIKDLETTFLSKVATSDNEQMVKAYSTNPKEEKQVYGENETTSLSYSLCYTQLKGMQDFIMKVKFDEKDIVKTAPDRNAELLIDKFKKINKKIKNLLADVKYQLDELGLYGGSLGALSHLIQVEKIKLGCETDEMLNIYTAVSTCLLTIRNVLHLDIDTEPEERQIIKYSSPKVLTLLKILRQTKENDSTIVFVTRRFTAKVLFYLIKDLSERNQEFRHIKPNFVVGYNVNPFNDTREGAFSRYNNRTVLKDFHENEINTLVASDVIEEGIDIGSCNYVIMFDLPKNFRSYVQSKGRARNKDSRYILMIPNYDQSRFHKVYQGYNLLEGRLKEFLSGKGATNRQCPDDKEINDKLYGTHITPYLPRGPEGPRVTENSAITLINRYCSSLVRDKFTKVAINWWVKRNLLRNKVKCYVQLPSDCPLRHIIEGPEQSKTILAKRAVAMEACKQLYELGEFDSDEFLPIGRTSLLASHPNLLPNWEDEPDTVDGNDQKKKKCKTGLRDNKRLCFKQFPECLSNCQPEPNKDVYLHLIKLMPVYQEPTNDRLNVFYHLLKSDYEFGILSSKPLPRICQFPIYMNVGELFVTVESNIRTLQLSEEDIHYVANLHSLIFLNLLQLVKTFMMRDTESKENSYLIVPVKPGVETSVEIDWDIVRNIKSIQKVKEPSKEVRRQLVVNDCTHLGSVISPWYRSLLPQQNYVVTKVCSDMTEKSQFPSEEFQSYEDYFRNKYNIEVFCKDQPLLEVKAISSKINCIRPRGLSKQSGRRRKLDEEGFDETLIPEFCVKFDFPAVYWLKATALPSILHRIHYLMIAEEFRMQIVRKVKLGRMLKAGECWKPLLVDPICDLAKDQLSGGTPTLVSKPVHKRTQVDRECPWGEEPVPIDLERCLSANLLEIKEYNVFVNKPLSSDLANPQKQQKQMPVIIKQMVDPPKLNIFSIVSNLGPQQYEVMQALTAQTAADVVNFERLETLGDSFLKYAVSLALFLKYPDMTEGQLTLIKGKVVGNRNLYYCGNKVNLGSHLKVHEFSATEDWIPPGFCVPHTLQSTIRAAKLSPSVLFNLKLTDAEQIEGKINDNTMAVFQEKLLDSIEEEDMTSSANAYLVSQQVVADKTVADAVEAIIGVYIKNCGVAAGIRLLRWLGVMEKEVLNEEILTSPSPDPRVSSECINGTHHLVAPSKLEAILNYTFRDRHYLLQALTHSTYAVNTVTRSYQRLEFLGDAIIDFLVTAHIFEKCSDSLTPGDLTDLRSALVNNITLASIVVRYGIHKFLLTRSAKLNELITKFVIQQENHNFSVGNDVLLLIEEKECNAAENVDVPKVLGDVFESIVGAIYLDCGKDLNTVWKVVYNLMKEEIELYSRKVPKNPVRMLYEENANASFEESVLTDEGLVMVPLSVIHDRKYQKFYGFGDKKSQAKVAAAKMALRYLNSMK